MRETIEQDSLWLKYERPCPDCMEDEPYDGNYYVRLDVSEESLKSLNCPACNNRRFVLTPKGKRLLDFLQRWGRA